VANSISNLQAMTTDSFARTQLLFSGLLPQRGTGDEKSSSLLPFGTPALERPFTAAMELAKPSPRFGLLLVSSSNKA
jgi:conserved oligomeric Golgi complex subunit 1